MYFSALKKFFFSHKKRCWPNLKKNVICLFSTENDWNPSCSKNQEWNKSFSFPKLTIRNSLKYPPSSRPHFTPIFSPQWTLQWKNCDSPCKMTIFRSRAIICEGSFPLKIWIMHTSIRSEHSAVAEQPWTLGANKRYVGVSYSLLILYLCIIIRTYVSLFKKFGNILVSEFHTDLETCSVRENSYVLSSKLII